MFKAIIKDDTESIAKSSVHADRLAQGVTDVSYETLLWTVDDDGVATLTLHRPDALNAFNLTMARELEQVFLDRRPRRRGARGRGHRGRASVLRRHGPLRRGQRVRARRVAWTRRPRSCATHLTEAPYHDGVRDTGGRVTLAIHALPKPVIAAINGPRSASARR